MLAPLVLTVAAWEILALSVSYIRGVPFPTPFETFRRLGELIAGQSFVGHSLYRHTLDSLIRWTVGFSVASLGGLMCGLAAGWWRSLERVTMPMVYGLQLVPGLAWIPVAILMFGVGEKATLFMIAVTAFAPVCINVAAGVKNVDVGYIRAAQMLGAGRWVLFRRVLVPGALPQILSGLRVGLGNGWRVLVAAEMIVGTGTGLGYSIIQARWTLDYASAFVCIIVICAIGLIVERFIFMPLERRTLEQWGLPRTA